MASVGQRAASKVTSGSSPAAALKQAKAELQLNHALKEPAVQARLATEPTQAQKSRAKQQTRLKAEGTALGDRSGVGAQARALTAPIRRQVLAKAPTKGMTLAQAVAPDKQERQSKAELGASLGGGLRISATGVLRTVGNTLGAIGSNVYHHPGEELSKDTTAIKNMVKGAAGAAIGVPEHVIQENVDKVLHPNAGPGGSRKVDSTTAILSRMGGAEVKRISDTYGPSYRGDKGSGAKLRKNVRETGGLVPALDLLTAAQPLSAGLGKAARVAADAGIGGRGVEAAAAATRDRPLLKRDAVTRALPQTVRKGAIGAAGAKVLDVARAKVTAADIKRAEAGKAKVIDRVRGNGLVQPARADRRTLAADEVAPLTRVAAARKLRTAAATSNTRMSQASNLRKARAVADLAKIRDSVPSELHPVLNTMIELGIRDSAGAKALLPRRIAQIEADRAAALSRAGKTGKTDAAAEAHAQGEAGQLANLKALLRDPSPFDHPGIAAAATAEDKLQRAVVGGREGASAETLASGRSRNVGRTLQVKTAKEINAEAKVAHAAEVERQAAIHADMKHTTAKDTAEAERELVRARASHAAARREHAATKASAATAGTAAERATALGGKAAVGHAVSRDLTVAREEARAADAALARATHAHAGSRAQLRHAQGRAEVLHRNVTGREARGSNYAGGGLGVTQAERALGETADLLKAARARAEAARVKRVSAESASKGVRDTVRRAEGGRAALRPVGAVAERRLAASQGKVDAAEARVAAADSNARAARLYGKDARDATKGAVKDARKAPLKKVNETGVQYEARVAAANKELHPNLAAPGYLRAGFEREADPAQTLGRDFTDQASNHIKQRSKGTLYRLGRSETDYKAIESDMLSKIHRGALHEWESRLIHEHGKVFHSESALKKYAAEKDINLNPDLGRVDVEMVHPTGGMLRKDLAPVRTGKSGRPAAGSDAGDYHQTDAVVLMPKEIAKQLRDLHAFENASGKANAAAQALRGIAHYSQAILLGGSLSWFQFQRVNDVLAALVGGSLPNSRAYSRYLKGLDNESRDQVHIFSGGAVSSASLKPNAVQEMGHMRQLLESVPLYKRALESDRPLTRLLADQAGKNPLTGLLRADQAITKGFRERQFVHNLARFARENDARVAGVNHGYMPIADAFKNADFAKIDALLKDPDYQHVLEDAAQQLYKVHGDWHNFTAAERRYGATAGFYGFLRYATRMALFTLPLGHPVMALMLAQLGNMSANDAKAIIGPDQPWGLGAIYNSDGTVAADLSRANPLASPLFNLNKPEDVIGLATPMASIAASYLLGENIGLSDSATGFVRQFTTNGQMKPDGVGNFLSPERLRIALRQVLDLAAPTREWDKFDAQQQSDDSLPWSRRHMDPGASAAYALRLQQKNSNAVGGVAGLLHNEFPLLSPGSKKNLRVQGQGIAAAKLKANQAKELTAAQTEGSHTPRGQFKLEIGKAKLEQQQILAGYKANLDAAKRELQLAKARNGG